MTLVYVNIKKKHVKNVFMQLKCRIFGSGGGFSTQGDSPSWGFSIWGVSIWGVSIWGGVLHPGGGGSPSGGFSIRGVLHPGGFSIRGGWGALHPGGFSIQGGVLHQGGVPCDLSHHAFDVTCMLPPHQLRHTNCAPAYILPGHVTCNASWDTPPPWTDRHL